MLADVTKLPLQRQGFILTQYVVQGQLTRLPALDPGWRTSSQAKHVLPPIASSKKITSNLAARLEWD